MSELYLTLHEVAARTPGRPHMSSVWRWCRKGIKARNGERIKLAHIRVGGRVLVPADAVERFFREVAEADALHFDAQNAPPPAPAARRTSLALRRKQIEEARRTLEKHGITWTPAEGGETGGAQ